MEFEVAGYGTPDRGKDAAHLYTNNDHWFNVEKGDSPFTQAALESGRYDTMVIKDEKGRYHTIPLEEWDESDIEDLYDYIEHWLDSQYE